MMIQLPTISELIKRTQALAALDLIMSPEWEFRYYSFDSKWAEGEQMASMRNGCGDEWWMVFHVDGWAAVKGIAHESPAFAHGGKALSTALKRAIPSVLSKFANQPAFSWEDTSFAAYRLSDHDEWVWPRSKTKFATLDGDEAHHLQLLVGSAQDYATFASEYYERDIQPRLVQHVFDHQPINKQTVEALNDETDYDEIKRELFSDIAYPGAAGKA